jgi:class 3 adenylate cyclase/predicted ATPase
MQQVADWLEKLGLGQYAQRFAENDISFSILPDLTDQDLKEIGVSLGHRRELLRAIANLGNSVDAASPAPSRPAPPIAAPTVTPLAEAAGERRHVTVMFCELVDSTGIAAKLDAEEWRDLVGAYLDAASAAVTEMGGKVAKKLGDGLMALFGYPVAQENDAERAVRAALAIQHALAELNRKNEHTGRPALAARVAIDTGPAVIDATGEIFGDVPNIAARAQAQAEPGTVVVTIRVQRQIAGLFVAEERGSHELKGVLEPVTLFRIVRASGAGRRAGQRHLTPLVGRDDEIAMLMRRWDRARQGDGQLVLIVGEPGLGKSRLVEEFHSRLRETPHTWVEWSCSQLLQNTPLHPVTEWGRQRFGGADVPAERRLADLENTLTLIHLDPGENVPLLAPLLDIPLPRERAPALAPEELRRRQFAALTGWTIASAKVQPLVLAFEDLHWADPTMLDVLRGLAERGALAPLFIVATARPEFRPPWSIRSHHGTISLAPLDRSQVRDMVAELSARYALPKEVVEDVAARTGGVPLFVEEVTRLLLERGGEQGGIHAIPPTLQQSLMARLDRLGPAREVAHVGAVIGRGFSYGLLRAVAGVDDAPLQAALEKLADADTVLVQGLPPDSDYRFKHALIQDAAYENLLKSRRQALHRRVAETLRDRFADTAAAEPEALAHHFTQAGLTDAAIEWWGKAGDQALRRSAFQEAISHLGKAIEMADKADVGAARAAPTVASAGERLKLQTDYGQAMMWSKGYAAAETRAAFARARELTAGIKNPPERFVGYYAQWVDSATRGEWAFAREAAETLRREAENEGRATEQVVGLRILGLTCLLQGDLIEARAYLEEALKMYDPARDRAAQFRFGHDAGAAASTYLAFTNWLLGDVGDTQAHMNEAVARGVEINHATTLVNIYHLTAIFEMARGDVDAARRAAQAEVDLSREHGLPVFLLYGGAANAWVLARRGDVQTGVAELREALARGAEQGIRGVTILHRGLLAELEAEGQDVEAALARIDETLALADETGERWTDSLLHRVRGEILWKRDPVNTAPAEGAFLTAIAIAQHQKARSFELRAALSLAKFYQSTSRTADAHAVLAPALQGFSPTSEFPEIEEAQKLLAVLTETDEVKNAAAARQRRLQLQTDYGQALLWSRGFGSQEAKVALDRAQELAVGSDSAAARFSAYYGRWLSCSARGEIGLARQTAERFLREAKIEGRMVEAAVASRNLGLSCFWQGDFTEAQTILEEALRLCDSRQHPEVDVSFGQDTVAQAKAALAATTWALGEITRARVLFEAAIARAVETAHAPTLVNAHWFKALLDALLGDADAALRDATRVIELSREYGLAEYLAQGMVLFCWARVRCGDSSDSEIGVAELLKAIVAFASRGTKFWLPFYQGLLAEVEAERQDVEQALIRTDEALGLAQQTGEHWSDAFLHRLRGEILLKRDPANLAPAEKGFQTAIAAARAQQARSFELRAAMSMARLWRDQGKRDQARELLAPVYGWFTEGFGTRDLKEAKALLEELRS